MENIQHSKNENVTDKQEGTSFSNSQPGQQLPREKHEGDFTNTSATGQEQHSESSKPEKDNETLGTP